ncbi:MAG: hypothetical protein CSB47_03295 [Proteobacteria bacterium]|nr:MAG: hypothetical protein CSB47_03295 [Pseudomonadota bacterium]
MVLDTLSGRTPLYRLEEFMAAQDRKLLLGETTDPELLNDNNLGRTLDRFFEAGSSKILAKLGIQATKSFSLDPTVVTCIPGFIVTRWIALLPFFCRGLFASWLFLLVEWHVPGLQNSRLNRTHPALLSS